MVTLLRPADSESYKGSIVFQYSITKACYLANSKEDIDPLNLVLRSQTRLIRTQKGHAKVSAFAGYP